MMKTFLNAKFLSKINVIGFNRQDHYIMIMWDLLNENTIFFQIIDDNEIKEITEAFFDYYQDVGQLEIWFGITGIKLRPYIASLLNELIDYHGQYHKTMKELFLFNRFWSKEKLFYNLSQDENSKVKYKNINYINAHNY